MPIYVDMTFQQQNAALLDARDQLVALRDDLDQATSAFSWPDVGAEFNFVHDWFDPFARGNDTPGLVIAELGGGRTAYSFDDLVRRSEVTADFLSRSGLRRGDSVIVMLNNQIELWEAMLAAIRIGAVLMPTTTAVGPAELIDRLSRGRARAVICNATDAGKFDEVPGDYLKIGVGVVATDDWRPYPDTGDVTVQKPTQHPGNRTTDPLLLYFTSGTTSRPKLVEHTHYSYPVGHLSTMYWLGLRPGDVHMNISSPGWGSTPGPTSSPHGWLAPPSTCSTTTASTLKDSWSGFAPNTSPACALRRPCGGC